MTTQHSPSAHSTPLNHSEESTSMNLEILAQLESSRREADVRHHVDERSLERAAKRRRDRTATSDADGPGRWSRLIAWLAPRRVATASGTTTMEPLARSGHVSGNAQELVAPQHSAVKATEVCTAGMECAVSTANRAA
jgi:hypothetical protein